MSDNMYNGKELVDYIDHTLLKPDATDTDIKNLCRQAIEYGFKGVCVNSTHVALVSSMLKDKKPVPVAVVGFPLGAMHTAAKAYEAKNAIIEGAKEIDMVIDIGSLKSKNYERVFSDIKEVVDASGENPVKVILETFFLTDEEKIIACTLAKSAKAAFVKTSTGFAKGGATVEDIALMRRVVGKEMGVKASGGIRTISDAKNMINAGANRLGVSSSVALMSE